jgi:ATP-dependent Lon protease
MRDFRDAKAMAQTLRKSLIAKDVTIGHGESLELVAKMLGAADWNTLSAMLQTSAHPDRAPSSQAVYPALPIRDFVPFPAGFFPLFVGREKTRQALDLAFQRNREVVLAVQKDARIDEPSFGDVYEIGVLAGLLELERLPPDRVRKEFRPRDGSSTMKILLRAHRRVKIRRFVATDGVFQAEMCDLSEGPIPNAPKLIRQAIDSFDSYVTAFEAKPPSVPAGSDIHDPMRTRDRRVQQMRELLPGLVQIRDPGRMADVIAPHLRLPVGGGLELLAMLDPVARLEKIVALMG